MFIGAAAVLPATGTVIRASSLSMYSDCPRRAAARLFAPMLEAAGFRFNERPQNVGAAIGTACHAAAAVSLRAKKHTGDLGPSAHATDAAMESLRDSLREADVAFDDTSPNLDTAQKQVMRQTVVYRTQVAPGIEPAAVEHRLDWPAFKGGVLLSGQVDVAVNGGVLRDLKTGVITRCNQAQYGAYAFLWGANGFEITTLVEDYIARVRISKPQPPAVAIRYPVADATRAAEALIRRIEADREAFLESCDETVFLANPHSMLCGAKWCNAWGTNFCTAHKGA